MEHYAYRDISHHLQKIDAYTTLIAEQWVEEGRRATPLHIAVHPILAFLRNYVMRAGIRAGRRRPHHLAAELVLRLPEICEAVGAPARALMFSLHVDTARTWRGGQNQVLVTVLGLRAIGHRTMLVAHPGGELRRRAEEGLELLPLAPVTEMDLSAAWRLSRAIKQLQPDIIHAHDPHAVAMSALALSMSTQLVKPPLVASRRVDFHLRGNSLSRWKYRQVDMFICASDAIRTMLLGDGVPPQRAVTVHEGIDLARVAAAPRRAAARGALAAARLTDRGQRRRARGAQRAEAPRRRRRPRRPPGPGRAVRDCRRRGAARRRSNSRSSTSASRNTCCSPASAPTSSRCTRLSTSSS